MKVAAVQMDIKIFEKERNLARVIAANKRRDTITTRRDLP